VRGRTLLIADSSVNLLLGIFLVVLPRGAVAALGIPMPTPGFYASVLGGVLFGIGLALLLEARALTRGTGLGLGGAIIINCCGGLVLVGWLLLGNLTLPVRGSIVLWSLAALLLAISAAEAWHASRGGKERA
jgi:uncharacterized membrane-anchored protein YitT (DUF2179 family)